MNLLTYKNIGLIFIVGCLSCGQMANNDLVEEKFSEDTSVFCTAGCDPIKITYELPASPCLLNSQETVNCFAWKTFIALNWKASGSPGEPDTLFTASSFGDPGDYSNTVWESYSSLGEVFGLEETDTNARMMNRINKFGKNHFSQPLSQDSLNSIKQAKGSWLTDQSGNLVWYEIKINPTEANFIKENKLYQLDEQKKYAHENGGVWSPVGSIEIKAAWRIIDKDSLDYYKPFYKISEALIPEIIGFNRDHNPIFGNYSRQYIGLVGLHIIHKTDLTPQYVWMTFEHVHNAPTEGEVDENINYTFYNKNDSSLKPNVPPTSYNIDSLHIPVQVERIKSNSISEEIKKLNNKVHNLITANSPFSFWQYYQLVNVQWPESPVSDSLNRNKVPLYTGDMTPTNIANTTLETYAQTTQCISCHKNAKVKGTRLPTDYSFIYKYAK